MTRSVFIALNNLARARKVRVVPGECDWRHGTGQLRSLHLIATAAETCSGGDITVQQPDASESPCPLALSLLLLSLQLTCAGA